MDSCALILIIGILIILSIIIFQTLIKGKKDKRYKTDKRDKRRFTFDIKKEKYQPTIDEETKTLVSKRIPDSMSNLPDDVVIYEILPFLPLADLIKFTQVGEEQVRLTKKFVKNFLKLGDIPLCDLRRLKYYSSQILSLKLTYPRLEKGKAMFDTSAYSKTCLNILFEALQNLKPPMNYLTKVENEWVIYNDFGNANQNYFEFNDDDEEDFLDDIEGNEKFNDLNYWVATSKGNEGLFSNLLVWMNDDVPLTLGTYFMSKFQELDKLQKTSTIPTRYEIPAREGENRLQNSIYKRKDRAFDKNLVEMRDFNEGTLFIFKLFLDVHSFENTFAGYKYFVQYLVDLPEWRELQKELDDLLSDSD